MNYLQMKYASEIAKTLSVNKAAANLMITQPNLSRQIKALESELGITIFERSSKGMTLTLEGEEFIGHIKGVIERFEEVESIYHGNGEEKVRFAVCMPRATYLSEAFTEFSKKIGNKPAELFLYEANSADVIRNVSSMGYDLGIIRTAVNHESYFDDIFAEKGLSYKVLSEFIIIMLMSRDNPVASLPVIRQKDLSRLTEVAHADPYVPTLPYSQVRRDTFPCGIIGKSIFVFERGSQLDILSENKETFMWVSPITDKTLERYGLVQRVCVDFKKKFRDILIYKKGYKFRELDYMFLEEVERFNEKYVKGYFEKIGEK